MEALFYVIHEPSFYAKLSTSTKSDFDSSSLGSIDRQADWQLWTQNAMKQAQSSTSTSQRTSLET
jgi:hypothetical protein